MEQTKADLWNLKTSTITSFFKLSLADGHPRNIDQGPIITGRRGLGWSFVFQTTENEDIAEIRRDGTKTSKHTLFSISITILQIAVTSLNKLTIIVEVGKDTISEMIVHATEISLSAPESVPLVSMHSLPNFTGDIAIEVRVGLPTTFELGGEPSGFKQKWRYALTQSLLGEKFEDIRFALFNRRGGNDVTDPKIIFANKSLLRGHTTSLDDLLSDPNALVSGATLAGLAYNAYDYPSDSDLESMSVTGGKELRTRQKKVQPSRRKLGHSEKAIIIRDVAFSTWKALVFYFYCGELHFKRLASTVSFNVEMNDSDITCSPKSMYRLALKIGHEELRRLSLKAITCDLKKDNIVKELFSYFTSMHPEVQEVEVEAFILLLKEPSVTQELIDQIKSITAQGLPHCSAIVAAIVGRLGELVISERPLQLLGNERHPDKIHDNINDNANEDEDDGDDIGDDKKKSKRNGPNKIKKRKDDSKGEKSSRCDRNKPKPSEGDKNKPQCSEGDNNEGLELSDTEETYNYSSDFPYVERRKGGRFDILNC